MGGNCKKSGASLLLGCNRSFTSSSSSSSSPTLVAHSKSFASNSHHLQRQVETTKSRFRAGPYLQQSKSQSLYRQKYQHCYIDCTSKYSQFCYNFLHFNFFQQMWQEIGHNMDEKLYKITHRYVLFPRHSNNCAHGLIWCDNNTNR